MVDHEGYGTLALTDAARRVLKGEQTLLLRRETVRSSKSSTPRAKPVHADLPNRAIALYERLRQWRAEIARSHGVPAYVIFHDATLREIAIARPVDLTALSHITGVGARKLESYGQMLLGCIASETADEA